jgi:hypothetical protein
MKNKGARAAHDRAVKLVDQMLDAERHRAVAVTDSAMSYYESRCRDLDQHIDKVVSELYGLSTDDCRLIDGELEK